MKRKKERINSPQEYKRACLHYYRPRVSQKPKKRVLVEHEQPLYRDLYQYYEVPVEDTEALPFMRERLVIELRKVIEDKQRMLLVGEVMRLPGVVNAISYLRERDQEKRKRHQ